MDFLRNYLKTWLGISKETQAYLQAQNLLNINYEDRLNKLETAALPVATVDCIFIPGSVTKRPGVKRMNSDALSVAAKPIKSKSSKIARVKK